jgi:hypothetical protein
LHSAGLLPASFFAAGRRDLISARIYVSQHLPTTNLENYKSGSQRARVSTEPWGEANLYCAACDSPRISSLPTGTHAVDFSCPSCASRYQLKSSASKLGNRVIDGVYAAMHRAILNDQTPNLFFLHYKLPQLTVESVLLILVSHSLCHAWRNATHSYQQPGGLDTSVAILFWTVLHQMHEFQS